MDPIARHAEIVADHSTGIDAGDEVLVMASPAAEEFVVAFFEVCGERGARPTWSVVSPRALRAYLNALDGDVETSDLELAQVRAADVVVFVGGNDNAMELADVAPERMSGYQVAQQPIEEVRMDKPWVITQFPTSAAAQEAEMSTDGYAEFVQNAVDIDWGAQHDFQENLVEILDEGSEVRIVAGDTTDIRMSIDGMVAVNDFGEHNLPGGEVYTAPVPDSVEGEVLFDMPVLAGGREITGARLVFEAGKVVEYGAEKNEDLLGELLATDDGATQLGELGIGMNRGIDRFTNNMLFDEKMGDTVHLAIGAAIPVCVPEDAESNESAVHLDMILDVSADSYIEVDGEIVQRDGTFVFEEGFVELQSPSP